MNSTTLTLPLTLTLIRLIVSPLLLPLGLVYLLPYNNILINNALALLFVLLGLTDFFDGYLARKYNQETNLGKTLDPLADKFHFFSALIALVAVKKIFFFWAIIFIGREFFIMGLRILALEQGFDIPVSWLGKCKTFFQMAYITCLIGNYSQTLGGGFVVLEKFLLISSLLVSLVSAYKYFTVFRKRSYIIF